MAENPTIGNGGGAESAAQAAPAMVESETPGPQKEKRPIRKTRRNAAPPPSPTEIAEMQTSVIRYAQENGSLTVEVAENPQTGFWLHLPEFGLGSDADGRLVVVVRDTADNS